MVTFEAPAACLRMCEVSFLQGYCECAVPVLFGEMEQTTGEGALAKGGAQSAIPPQWFCDELGAGDGCKGRF
jgi:hypothetical protein